MKLILTPVSINSIAIRIFIMFFVKIDPINPIVKITRPKNK
jgi:hypothetical protein